MQLIARHFVNFPIMRYNLSPIDQFGGTFQVKPFQVEFSDHKLTGSAGLVHLGRFARKLGVQEILARRLSISRGENATYDVHLLLTMIMVGVWSGVKHLSQMFILKGDGAIRKVFGWDSFPHNSTFGRVCKLFRHSHCQELSDAEGEVRRKVWSKKWFGSLTLDLDSSVRGVYGSQEGAAKGYNPHKKGQKSYHPLFCFVAQNRECLHNWFRAGDAYSANGAAEFLQECYSRLPKRVWKLLWRGDCAFFDGKVMNVVEERQGQYLFKVSLKGLAKLLMAQTWHPLRRRPGWEGTEFQYRCRGWKRSRRFVAVRRLVREDTAGRFFPRPHYEFFCYVTNLDLTPWSVHKLYGKRATSENWIEWCKNQMAAGSILTQDFWANSALFQTCILAYNLLAWLMWLTTRQGFREEPQTIRVWLLKTPGRLITSGRRLTLKLPRDYFFKEQWEQLESSLTALSWA
jgi:Transposase DDE domain group 1